MYLLNFHSLLPKSLLPFSGVAPLCILPVHLSHYLVFPLAPWKETALDQGLKTYSMYSNVFFDLLPHLDKVFMLWVGIKFFKDNPCDSYNLKVLLGFNL